MKNSIITTLIIIVLASFSPLTGQVKENLEKDGDSAVFIQNNDSLIKTKNDSLSNLWYAENWDNTVYNPYKNETIKFPFKIVFEDSNYTSPIDRKKVITSRYGWRNRGAHKGIDIDLITGDKVRSMFAGKVRFVGSQAGHGKLVVVRHKNGLETVYAHLSKHLVKVNDTVAKGQVIGKGGTTGNARGSHLHLEVTYKGIHIYPEYLFEFGENNKIRSPIIWVTKNWVTPYVHNSKRQSIITICNTYEEALEAEQKRRQIYIVKRGDSLSRISRKHRVSIASICKTNSIRKRSTLRIGQRLVLIK